MGKPNDGGAAFARPIGHMTTGRFSDAQEGISARDYFAAHAPVTIGEARDAWFSLNIGAPDFPKGAQILEQLAKMRFAYADSMLAERAK